MQHECSHRRAPSIPYALVRRTTTLHLAIQRSKSRHRAASPAPIRTHLEGRAARRVGLVDRSQNNCEAKAYFGLEFEVPAQTCIS